jgi:molybdate transport system ATP-binding protein
VFVPVHRRALGYVFQEASLFPHLSVRANLDFGRRRVAAAERRFAPAAVAELLGIGHLLERRPTACRVANASAPRSHAPCWPRRACC